MRSSPDYRFVNQPFDGTNGRSLMAPLGLAAFEALHDQSFRFGSVADSRAGHEERRHHGLAGNDAHAGGVSAGLAPE